MQVIAMNLVNVNKCWLSTVFIIEHFVVPIPAVAPNCTQLRFVFPPLFLNQCLQYQVLDQLYQSVNYFLHINFRCCSWLYVSPNPVVSHDLVSITVLFTSIIVTGTPCQVWVKQSLHIRDINRLLYTVCLLKSVLVRHSSFLLYIMYSYLYHLFFRY